MVDFGPGRGPNDVVTPPASRHGDSGLRWHRVAHHFSKAAVLGLSGMLLQKPSNRSTHRAQTTRKHSTLSEVQLFHGGSCQWSVCIKMLSPWETPLKLSLYVIYTENKPRAKNHRERLFKHNSHGPWKMIKADSLIVHLDFFRIS